MLGTCQLGPRFDGTLVLTHRTHSRDRLNLSRPGSKEGSMRDMVSAPSPFNLVSSSSLLLSIQVLNEALEP
jgi:hypothetical protein